MPAQDRKDWFKSTFSGNHGCVEVRLTDKGVQVRHTRAREGAVLEFTRNEWEAFLLGAANGEFAPG